MIAAAPRARQPAGNHGWLDSRHPKLGTLTGHRPPPACPPLTIGQVAGRRRQEPRPSGRFTACLRGLTSGCNSNELVREPKLRLRQRRSGPPRPSSHDRRSHPARTHVQARAKALGHAELPGFLENRWLRENRHAAAIASPGKPPHNSPGGKHPVLLVPDPGDRSARGDTPRSRQQPVSRPDPRHDLTFPRQPWLPRRAG